MRLEVKSRDPKRSSVCPFGLTLEDSVGKRGSENVLIRNCFGNEEPLTTLMNP